MIMLNPNLPVQSQLLCWVRYKGWCIKGNCKNESNSRSNSGKMWWLAGSWNKLLSHCQYPKLYTHLILNKWYQVNWAVSQTMAQHRTLKLLNNQIGGKALIKRQKSADKRKRRLRSWCSMKRSLKQIKRFMNWDSYLLTRVASTL